MILKVFAMAFLATVFIVIGTIMVSTNIVPGVVSSWDRCRTPEAGVFIPEDHPSLKLDENGCILIKEEEGPRR